LRKICTHLCNNIITYNIFFRSQFYLFFRLMIFFSLKKLGFEYHIYSSKVFLIHQNFSFFNISTFLIFGWTIPILFHENKIWFEYQILTKRAFLFPQFFHFLTVCSSFRISIAKNPFMSISYFSLNFQDSDNTFLQFKPSSNFYFLTITTFLISIAKLFLAQEFHLPENFCDLNITSLQARACYFINFFIFKLFT